MVVYSDTYDIISRKSLGDKIDDKIEQLRERMEDRSKTVMDLQDDAGATLKREPNLKASADCFLMEEKLVQKLTVVPHASVTMSDIIRRPAKKSVTQSLMLEPESEENVLNDLN